VGNRMCRPWSVIATRREVQKGPPADVVPAWPGRAESFVKFTGMVFYSRYSFTGTRP